MADPEETRHYYDLTLSALEEMAGVDAVLAVAHDAYRSLGLSGMAGFCQKEEAILVDVKGLLDPAAGRFGIEFWWL